jgi:hypothetical protein
MPSHVISIEQLAVYKPSVLRLDINLGALLKNWSRESYVKMKKQENMR